MCDEPVNDLLVALKLIPEQFVTGKMNKKVYNAFDADDAYSFLINIQVMSRFAVMKWVILVQILIILILIIILIKMILVLLFSSDFWLGLVNLKRAKHLRKPKLTEELMPMAWHPKRW